MPTYQYRCLNCKRRFEVFMPYQEYGTKSVRCTHCGSDRIQRRIGRIRFARSDDSRMEDFADPSSLDGLEDDPKALGRMMRKMKTEMGSEMDEDIGPEFDEVVDRLEKGQSPEEIEQAMPGLADAAGAGDDLGGGDDF
jgi:putative FmdB family regulatory protein